MNKKKNQIIYKCKKKNVKLYIKINNKFINNLNALIICLS